MEFTADRIISFTIDKRMYVGHITAVTEYEIKFDYIYSYEKREIFQNYEVTKSNNSLKNCRISSIEEAHKFSEELSKFMLAKATDKILYRNIKFLEKAKSICNEYGFNNEAKDIIMSAISGVIEELNKKGI